MKSPASLPRVILVTRKSALHMLLEHHGTMGQAAFYLKSRGQDIREYQENHVCFQDGLADVIRGIPARQRRIHVDRAELDRFLFAADDIVLVIGQDGLVPNAAKYLQGQIIAGINPDPGRFDGVLCPHMPADAPKLLEWMSENRHSGYRLQRRTMAIAEREDGQQLLALNEVFVGHRTHQSARYVLCAGRSHERQSSSGVICATGTGCTGWVRSISGQRGRNPDLPKPDSPQLVWFVREPFPSVVTGAQMDCGIIHSGQSLEIVSEMGRDGIVFADGIEQDNLEFLSGQTVRISISPRTLNLVVQGRRKQDVSKITATIRNRAGI
ncbi:MAG: hypothetical protein HZA50_16735 [Planctomycetes bacterium]|nr:hypothetical protein [Planctomycetota bacterium]